MMTAPARESRPAALNQVKRAKIDPRHLNSTDSLGIELGIENRSAGPEPDTLPVSG